MARAYRKILNTIIRLVNGEPIRVVNTYDALSRVVEVLHPNEHISTYKYDMLGNVIETKTPDAGTVTAEYTPQGQILSRTTANGEVVSYNYDFERLKSVAYSLHPNDSIVYTYGDSLSENFQKGRLISVRYPMGSEEYTYGNMGEVVKTVKSIVIDEQIDKIHSYTSEFEYDSWNRIQKMIYPDGEVVDYEYYSNGELKSITGEKDGISYPYLIETGYNVNGQTAYRKLGNNTEHRYFYDKKNRLQTSTLHIGSERISVNTYNYDKVDNITSIHDNSIYFQNYSYDELNRLISANGYDFGTIGDTPNSYSMTMEYNKMSSPIVFNQSITTDKGTIFKNNTYLYNQDTQPNAPIQIGDMHYTYDATGNPTSILDASGIGRDMVWDAENRLKEIIDTKEGLFHSYAYDHTGERILKRYGTAQNAYYNGKDMGTLYDFGESYSAYVSPYFVESNNGYTKHYYAGATRLVSKIGESVYENESYISYGDKEKDQYFYFQDHLGSSTYITDLNGKIAQYSAYTPYGEMFREYRNITPYRFNGKELDSETELYYYGARYYNPSTALWLGVDPLASKYPGVSPYVYCVGNPVKYVDPDGKEIVIGGILDRILNFWGLDDYVDKVRNDLITLKNIDPELNKLISVIESSKTKYYIYPTSENEGNSYDVQNNTIYYNPDNNTGVGGERPAIVGLAHELGHAENDENGIHINYNLRKVREGNQKEIEKLNNNELNSIYYENIVRESSGYEQRSYNYLDNKTIPVDYEN